MFGYQLSIPEMILTLFGFESWVKWLSAGGFGRKPAATLQLILSGFLMNGIRMNPLLLAKICAEHVTWHRKNGGMSYVWATCERERESPCVRVFVCIPFSMYLCLRSGTKPIVTMKCCFRKVKTSGALGTAPCDLRMWTRSGSVTDISGFSGTAQLNDMICNLLSNEPGVSRTSPASSSGWMPHIGGKDKCWLRNHFAKRFR